MSNSLRPHGLQHTKPPCPSPAPRVYSISCPLSKWCHPTISSSVVPFSSCLQSFPALGSFQRSQLFSKSTIHVLYPSFLFFTNKCRNSGNSDRLYFGGSKITADGDLSHGIKRCLLLGRKAMTNLDSILKSRDITLPTKVCLVKAMVFPVVMYGCESWTIKKAEHRRIDAFGLWCWEDAWESLGLQGDPTSPS